MKACNMKFLGSGARDTSLKYIWIFSIVLIFIYMYNLSKVYLKKTPFTCEKVLSQWKKSKCISVM